jgi:serine/threonine-protein kinase HipA
MKKCLGCYLPLKSGTYHSSCSKKLFGTDKPPEVNFGVSELEEMAKQSLSRHLGITGVQPKISVNLERQQENPKHRLMIVGLWGDFILKPPTKQFPDMSVVEDATMHMAEVVGITTARHGLIQLESGELAYVTKRFDREKMNKKIAVEDFCQLSGLLTESKYSTSTEKAGKIILKYSSRPGLDAVTFFDLNLFSFLTGNADMHLKNFSLMNNESGETVLSPAYDLLSTKLMPINDKEEMALTVNGKKAKLKRKDFIALGESLQIPGKAIENSFLRILKPISEMKMIVKNSFLSNELKKRYSELLDSRRKVLVD